MRLHEEIYTSAAELLDGGSSNLGVVARSRGFPRELEPDLAAQRAYTLLPELPLDALDRHPPRYVAGTRGSFYCLTRVTFAGADYSGRTAPLAHHLAIECGSDSLAARPRADLVIAAAAQLLTDSWTGPPRWIDPPRNLQIPSGEQHDQAESSEASDEIEELLPHLTDALISYGSTKRAIVIVAEHDAFEPIRVVQRILALLPPSIGWSLGWASHVVEQADHVRDTAILFTYPTSPYVDQCRRRQDPRAPILVELGQPMPAAVSSGAWSSLLRTCRSRSDVAKLGRRWDDLGLEPVHLQAFANTARAVLAIRAAGSSATLVEAISPSVATANHPSLLRWLAEAVSRRVGEIKNQLPPEAWGALLRSVSDPAWPDAVRIAIVDAAIGNSDEAVLALVRSMSPSAAGSEIVRQRIASHPSQPQRVLAAVERAIGSAAPAELELATRLIAVSAARTDLATALVDRVIPCGAAVKDALMPNVLLLLRTSLRDIDDVERICLHEPKSHDSVFAEQVCVPILRHYLGVARNDGSWRRLAALLVQVAARTGGLDRELNWLFKTFATRIDPRTITDLVHASEGQGAAIIRAANSAGISVAVDTQTPDITGHHQEPSDDSGAPRPRSVGPIRTNYGLAVFAVLGALLLVQQAGWARISGRLLPPVSVGGAPFPPLAMVTLLTVGIWGGAEGLIRLLVRSVEWFPTVRRVRRIAAVVLAVVAIACCTFAGIKSSRARDNTPVLPQDPGPQPHQQTNR